MLEDLKVLKKKYGKVKEKYGVTKEEKVQAEAELKEMKSSFEKTR